MLKNVVFPAPFGPIRLTIAPSGITKSTSFTATSPPNSLRSAWVSSSSSVTPPLLLRAVPDVHQRRVLDADLELGPRPGTRYQAGRSEQHDEHEDRPVDARGVQRQVAVAAEGVVRPAADVRDAL